MPAEQLGNLLFTMEPPVARVTLNRPAVRNAIDSETVDGLAAAVERAQAERAHVMVLSGAGDDFCAGADLEYVRSVARHPEALDGFVAGLARVLDRFEQAPFATIAALHGNVLAGGCEIMLACDITIATNDACIGDRHLAYGLLPGAGGSIRLSRMLPQSLSRYLLLTGETVTGKQAAAWGLVTMAVPTANWGDALERVVAALSRHSRDAIAAVKRMAVETRNMPHADAIVKERQLFLKHFRDSPDPHEGLAAFAERRQPRFGR